MNFTQAEYEKLTKTNVSPANPSSLIFIISALLIFVHQILIHVYLNVQILINVMIQQNLVIIIVMLILNVQPIIIVLLVLINVMIVYHQVIMVYPIMEILNISSKIHQVENI